MQPKPLLFYVYLFIITLMVLAVVTLVGNQTASAQTINRDRAKAVVERRLRRLEQYKIETESLFDNFTKDINRIVSKYKNKMNVASAALVHMIADVKDELCVGLGADAYCPEEEEVVSTGHTEMISFPVKVSFYNAIEAQTDHDPTKGAWGHDVVHFLNEGMNPVAASRDIATYPLGKESKITLVPDNPNSECGFLQGKTFLVIDKLSDCTAKNRDMRTGRCRIPIKNQIDVLIPCGDEDCFIGKAKARSIGMCNATLTKI